MANFPSYKPVYSAIKKSEPAVRTAEFAGGYQQRTVVGINQNPKEWSLSFILADEDANVIEAFLDARATDCDSFDWIPPDSSTTYKWVCSGWSKELFEVGHSRITATFRQTFDLG
jgi:phage-related protein